MTAWLAACSAGGSPADTSPPTTAPTTTAAVAPGAPATLLEVFDGDTLLANFDGGEEEVRLLGINAPETDECFGTEARDALEGLLAGGPLRLETQGERDQFGRLLAYAYAGDDLLNLSLLEGGFALAMHEDHRLLDDFLSADEAAYAYGRGMWAPGACGDPTGSSVSLVEIQANPPGPDEDNLNGEWVRLENSGSTAADLSGWVLRDESSANRYSFPHGSALPPGARLTVFVGCGDDRPGSLYWCAGGPVWNNGGDTALLLETSGDVAGRLSYAG
jgi:micrococcal nuclease